MAAKVLLTGATGFIATYIFKQLLEKGYYVIATVRSQEKAQWLANLVPEYKDQFVFETVKEIAVDGAFDNVFKKHTDIKYVLHTASPFFHPDSDPEGKVLTPAIKGTTSILQAVKDLAPTVEKVVITSSFAAVVDGAINLSDPNHVYTEKSWNPVTYEEAVSDLKVTYRGSKTFAEKAFWDFINKETEAGTIKFTGTTINPPFVFGPALQKIDSAEQLNTSNQSIYNLLKSNKDTNVPDFWFFGVHVADVAKAHILALETDKSAGQRWITSAGLFGNDQILATIEKEIPELKGKVATPRPYDLNEQLAKHSKLDNSKTLEQSGLKFISIEQALEEGVKNIYELTKKWESS